MRLREAEKRALDTGREREEKKFSVKRIYLEVNSDRESSEVWIDGTNVYCTS